MLGFKRERELNVASSRHIKKTLSVDENRFPSQKCSSDSKEVRYRMQLAQVIKSNSLGEFQNSRIYDQQSPVRSNLSNSTRCHKILDAPGLPKSNGAKVMSWGSHGLLIGLGDVIYKHDVENGQTIRVLYGNAVRQVSWASGSRFVGIVHHVSSDCVVLADAEHGHLRNISLDAFSTSMSLWEKVLAVCSTDNHVSFHDLRQKNSLVSRLGLESTPLCVSIRELTAAVGDSTGHVHVYDLRAMNKVSVVGIDRNPVSDLSWLSRRTLVAGGSVLSSVDLLASSFATPPTRREVCSPVTCMLLTGRGTLFSGHLNGAVCNRTTSLRCNHTLVGDRESLGGVACIAEDPVSGTVAVGYRDETIRFFRLPEACSPSLSSSELLDLR